MEKYSFLVEWQQKGLEKKKDMLQQYARWFVMQGHIWRIGVDYAGMTEQLSESKLVGPGKFENAYGASVSNCFLMNGTYKIYVVSFNDELPVLYLSFSFG